MIAWMMTNGWAYIFIGVGSYLNIKWMTAVGTGYIAFLWLPCTPEKLVTIPICMFVYKLLNKNKKEKKNEEEVK